MAGVNGKELSKREESWASEIKALDESLEDSSSNSLQHRFDAVKKLDKDLVSRAKDATVRVSSSSPAPTNGEDGDDQALKRSKRSSTVPGGFRRQKLAQVMQLLERETALVDAVTERLGRLGGLAG